MFENESDARAKLKALFPVLVKLEEFAAGPKRTRVVVINPYQDIDERARRLIASSKLMAGHSNGISPHRPGRPGFSALSFGSWVTYANQVDEKNAMELMSAARDHGVISSTTPRYMPPARAKHHGRGAEEAGLGSPDLHRLHQSSTGACRRSGAKA